MATIPGAVATARSSNNNLTISKPSGVVTGTLLVAQVGGRTANRLVQTVPSGWTLILTTGTGQPNQSLYWKIAGASEPSDYTFSYDDNTSEIAGGIIAITGHDMNSPIGPSSGVSGGSSGTAATTTITPAANSLIMIFANFSNLAAGSISTYGLVTSSPTFTEYWDSTSASGPTISMAAGIRAASTATGTASATGSSTSLWVGQVLSINPGVDVLISPSLLSLTSEIGEPPFVPNLLSLSTELLGGEVPAWQNAPKHAGAWSNTPKSS